MTRKRISDENKEEIIYLVLEEIENFKIGKNEGCLNNKELQELLDCSKATLERVLSDYLNEEELSIRKKMHERIQEKDKIALVALIKEEIRKYKENQEYRIPRNSDFGNILGTSSTPIRRIIKAYLSEEEKEILKEERRIRNRTRLKEVTRTEEHKERGRAILAKSKMNKKFQEAQKKSMEKLHNDYTEKEKRREMGRKIAEKIRKNSYFVENRFYTHSQQEGAVALMLEKYIPGYIIQEGKNFQIRDRKINNGGIDFLVYNEFLEWHPIILSLKGKSKNGEIPSNEDYAHYKKVLDSLPKDEKKELKEGYKKVLAINYRNSRQKSVDNSGYAGKKLVLCTNIEELYNFICEWYQPIWGPRKGKPFRFEDFQREFNYLARSIKKFRVLNNSSE